MDDETRLRLEQIEKKLEATYQAAEKTRKYLFWTGVVSILVIVLPAIGLIFVLPSFVGTYTQMGGLLQ